ncbi:MAG: hypothetical protein M3341_02995 [Actinomycetota bacterium]|nr:hypothetical protein [Actinomycetota bacterium]
MPGLFGLIPHGYTVFDNLLHLALGIVSIALGFFAGAGAARSWGKKRKDRGPSLERAPALYG